MGEAFLDYKKGGASGLNINGIIEDYYVYAGEKVNAGDFVEFVNGIAGKVDCGTSGITTLKSSQKSGLRISACKLTEDKVFVAHSGLNDKLEAMVCVISDSTISVGAIITLVSSSTAENASDAISVVGLSETSVFIAHSRDSNNYLYGLVCTIDGTTITKGTDTKLNTSASTGECLSTVLLKNGYVFIAHSSGTSYTLSGVVCKISGTTITKGSGTTLYNAAAGAQGFLPPSIVVLPNGNVFIAHIANSSSTYVLKGLICTISELTITKGTNIDLSSTKKSGLAISASVLTDNEVAIAHCGEDNKYLYGMVCAVDDKTITVKSDTKLSEIIYTGAFVSILTIRKDKVLIIHRLDESNKYLYGMVCKIENGVMVAGTDTIMNSVTTGGGDAISSLINSQGVIFVAFNSGGNSYLYAQLYCVDEENNIPTNEIAMIDYETQVRPATSLPCNGVASTSGEGGTSTGHKDVVSVYTVPYSTYNLIRNGEFNKGFDDWTPSTTDRVELSITNTKYLQATVVSPYTGGSSVSIILSNPDVGGTKIGHIYYATVDILGDANNAGMSPGLRITWKDKNNAYQLLCYSDVSNLTEWRKCSVVTNPIVYDGGLFGLQMLTQNSSGTITAGMKVGFDNLAVYDLTAMFGKGNEPTQEWCDANL